MRILLHGNGVAAPDGGVSPQLKGRLEGAIALFHARSAKVEKVCFFADDDYDGIRAHEFVHNELLKGNVPESRIMVAPVAKTTDGEVVAFAKHLGAEQYRGPLAAVTSFYHAPRCQQLFARHGYPRVEMVVVRHFAVRDLILEGPKLILECSPAGQRLKRYLKSRGQPRLVA